MRSPSSGPSLRSPARTPSGRGRDDQAASAPTERTRTKTRIEGRGFTPPCFSCHHRAGGGGETWPVPSAEGSKDRPRFRPRERETAWSRSAQWKHPERGRVAAPVDRTYPRLLRTPASPEKDVRDNVRPPQRRRTASGARSGLVAVPDEGQPGRLVGPRPLTCSTRMSGRWNPSPLPPGPLRRSRGWRGRGIGARSSRRSTGRRTPAARKPSTGFTPGLQHRGAQSSKRPDRPRTPFIRYTASSESHPDPDRIDRLKACSFPCLARLSDRRIDRLPAEGARGREAAGPRGKTASPARAFEFREELWGIAALRRRQNREVNKTPGSTPPCQQTAVRRLGVDPFGCWQGRQGDGLCLLNRAARPTLTLAIRQAACPAAPSATTSGAMMALRRPLHRRGSVPFEMVRRASGDRVLLRVTFITVPSDPYSAFPRPPANGSVRAAVAEGYPRPVGGSCRDPPACAPFFAASRPPTCRRRPAAEAEARFRRSARSEVKVCSRGTPVRCRCRGYRS